MADDLEFRIAKLELEPGDTLVVKTDRKPEHDVFRDLVPAGVKVLYIPSSVDLSVLRSSEPPVLLPDGFDTRPGAINRIDQ